MIGDYSYRPYGFRKIRDVCGHLRTDGGKVKVEHGLGYTDGVYDYGKCKDGLWYAINRATGCTVGRGETIQAAQDAAFDPVNQEKLKAYMRTPAYVTKCEEFNAALAEAGLLSSP